MTNSEQSVTLTQATADVLMDLRGYPGVTDELGHEHIRLNVLMCKGLANNVGLGRWEATDLGRAVTIHTKGLIARPAGGNRS